MYVGVPGMTVLMLPVSTISVGLAMPGGLVASRTIAAAGAGGLLACRVVLPALVASAGQTCGLSSQPRRCQTTVNCVGG